MKTTPEQKARNIKWYSIPENREKARQRAHERHHRLKNDPEYRAKAEARKTKWKKANPELIRASTARMRAKHGDKMNQRTKEWRKANPGYSALQNRRNRGYPQATRPEPAICECCGRKPNGRGSLHLDHCHETDKFRGWLCHSCNSGIGALGDNHMGLARAALYLDRADV